MDQRIDYVPRKVPVTVPVLWAALWILTAVTWMYDAAGNSVGMPMLVFFIVLASPLIVGFIYGWQAGGVKAGLKAGMLSGTLFGLANMAGHLVWSAILLAMGRVAPQEQMAGWLGMFEVLEFTLLFALTGLALGLLGGLIGAFMAQPLRQRTS